MKSNELTIAILEANIITLEARIASLQRFPLNEALCMEARVICKQVEIVRERMAVLSAKVKECTSKANADACATSKPMEAEEAFERGFCAYKNGVAKKENPNKTPLGHMRTVADINWERGWLAAEAQRTEQG